MITFADGGGRDVRVQVAEPAGGGAYPAILLLHGSGGAGSQWLERLSPALTAAGIAAYMPHYFESTGTDRATAEQILDGYHFPIWLRTAQAALGWAAKRPGVDPTRLAVLGVSLGGFLAMAMAAESTTTGRTLRAAVEISAGMPPGWEGRLSPACPPVLAIHGDRDTLVPVSYAHRLEELLKSQGIAHQLEILEGETHWFSMSAQMRLLLTVGSFLRTHL